MAEKKKAKKMPAKKTMKRTSGSRSSEERSAAVKKMEAQRGSPRKTRKSDGESAPKGGSANGRASDAPKRRSAPERPKAVSGMPDGGMVKSRPSTRDDLKEMFEFVKGQKRRTPPS